MWKHPSFPLKTPMNPVGENSQVEGWTAHQWPFVQCLVHMESGGARLGWEWSFSRWWFQIFFIFPPTWGNDPIWLIFFRWVETTNSVWPWGKKAKKGRVNNRCNWWFVWLGLMICNILCVVPFVPERWIPKTKLFSVARCFNFLKQVWVQIGN